ncbi:TlpA family protein disulfide reductase [Actinomycetospora straminea]|uniref:Thioredoxin domain-containing protein n=1 Tax=Actinomycetospora straminea TaxID=663607 RepID=A0ABP9F9A0_9PSEU|nr:thioredoxin family protein [Actinomycetospora straminea]MDD7936533.1 thioredoxin family protein [Actinomycetospora straminea]
MSGWVLVAVLAVVVVLLSGLVLVVLRGRRRRVAPEPVPDPVPDPGPEGTRRDLRPVAPRPGGPVGGVLPRDLVAPPGGLALLQLSSQFCADCRASRAVLTDVASEHPGVTVREVDVSVRPELVRLLGIRRTPTTLVVDPAGVELARTVGVPRRADLVGTLAPLRRTG